MYAKAVLECEGSYNTKINLKSSAGLSKVKIKLTFTQARASLTLSAGTQNMPLVPIVANALQRRPGNRQTQERRAFLVPGGATAARS